MKKILLPLFLFISLLSQAQTDTIPLGEVEILSTRIPMVYRDAARVVTVIKFEEIQEAAVNSVDELLEYVANVDIRQRGVSGVQADVSIRGGSFDQTLILLNGVKVSDPQTGHHNLNLPIDISCIERIEILEGAGARIYGPNAFAGAINIITRQPKEGSIRINMEGGDFAYLANGASAAFNTGQVHHMASITNRSSNGYRENTDFDVLNVFMQSDWESSLGNLLFQSGYTDKAFGANSFYTAKYPNQYEQTRTVFGSIRLQTKGKLHFTPQIYYRRHQDRFELFRTNPAVWYKGHNYHLTHVYGAQGNTWFAWAWGKTSFGAEYRVENIMSNVLGLPTGDTLEVPFENQGYFTKEAKRENSSIFVDHTVSFGKLGISAGTLVNLDSDFGWEFYPGIDMNYGFSTNLKGFASFSRTLRLPTFTDLYYADVIHAGNPDLEPEKAIQLETGIKLNSKLVDGNLSFFVRDGRNIIDWVRPDELSKWHSDNITHLRTAGGEFSMNYYPVRKNKKSLIRSVGVTYSYVSLEMFSGEFLSKYALDVLKHKAGLQLSHKIAGKLTARWNVLLHDRMGSYTDAQTGQEVQYSPYCTLDGRILYTGTWYDLFVEATNITDEKFFDIVNVPMPGRWVRLGASFHLEQKLFRK